MARRGCATIDGGGCRIVVFVERFLNTAKTLLIVAIIMLLLLLTVVIMVTKTPSMKHTAQLFLALEMLIVSTFSPKESKPNLLQQIIKRRVTVGILTRYINMACVGLKRLSPA